MERCININHPTVQEYSEKLQLPAKVVAAKIALWQDQNNSEVFPSIDELAVKSSTKITKSPAQFKKELIGRFGKKFGNNQTIIDSNRYVEVSNAVNNYNRNYGSKVLDLYKDTTDNWRLEVAKYESLESENEMTLGQLLNNMLGVDSTDYSDMLPVIVDKVKKYNPEIYDALKLDSVKFEVITRDEFVRRGGENIVSRAKGIYQNGKVTLFSDAGFTDEKQLSHVLLHELIHRHTDEVFTDRELTPKEALFKKRIEKLYREYALKYNKVKYSIAKANPGGINDVYGFLIEGEFVAELMSNGNFYRILEQSDEGRSMFQKAWDYFLELIGVKQNLSQIKAGIVEYIKSKDIEEDNSGKILFLQGEESEYQKFLNDVLASYASQIEKLESTSLNKIDTKENVELRIIQLRSEMNALKNSTDQALSIDNFVNNLYGEVISGVPFDPTVPYKGVFGWLNKHSFVDLVKEIKRKLQDEGIKDYEEAAKVIMYIRTYLDDMQPLLEQLQNIVEDYDDLIKGEGSGTISKIRTLLAVMNKAKKDLSNMQEIYLEGLDTATVDKESEVLVKKIDRQIQLLDQRITISTGDKKKNLEAEKKLLIDRRNTLSGSAKNRIHKELISASGDVSIFNMLFAPIWQSKDVVLKSVYKLVREKLEGIIPEFLKVSEKASSAFEQYKKAKNLNNLDKSKFNEGLYEKVKIGKTYFNKDTGQYVYQEGEEFLQLVDEFDILAYNKSLAELVALANKSDKLISVYKKGLSKIHKPKADWKNILTKKYEQYLKIYRGSDRGQIEFYNWLKQNTYVPAGNSSTRAKDLDALVTIGQITELDAAKTYIAEIMASDESAISFASKELYEIDKSKFKNPKVKELDEDQLKYLNSLKSLYQEAQDMLDDRGKLGLRLPSVRKSLTQKLVEKDFKSIKDSFSPDFIDATEDEMRDGSDIKSVPVYYAQSLDVNEVSTDLMQSIMLFYKQALRYKAMSEIEPQIKAIRQNMSIEALPGTVDSKGKPILDRIKKMIGSSVQLESAQDWRTLWFDQWIDQVLYGKTNLPINATIMGKDIRVDKLLDRLQGWAAFSQLGGIKFISHFANLSNALMQNLIESSAGQYYTTSEIGQAITKLKSLSEFLSKDVLKYRVDNPDVETSYSKIGQLFEIMQPFQAEYLQQLGTNISKSKAESIVDINNWFLPQNIGDSYPAMISTVAMLINQKVSKDGKEISLYDALNLDQESGKLDFQDIQLLEEDAKYGDVKTLMNKKLRPKLININEQIYGVYSSIGNIDAPLIRKHAFGRLLEMYRKFIVPGIKRRWKENDYNYQTESLEEGYYRTFWRMIKQDFIRTIQSDDSAFIKSAKVLGSLLYKSQEDYTKEEIQNIRRARAEYLALISLTLIGSLFYSLGAEGDDDDDALRGMGYLMMRLNSEIKFFHPLAPDSPVQFDSEGAKFNVPLSTGFPDWMRILKSPTALTTHAQNLSKVVTQVLEDPSEVYERSTSLADKGDNKLYINTLKLLGLNSGMSSKDAMATLKAFRQ